MQVTVKTDDDIRAGVRLFMEGPLSVDDPSKDSEFAQTEHLRSVVEFWRAIYTSEGQAEVTGDLSAAYDVKRILLSDQVRGGILLGGLTGTIENVETAAAGLDALALQVDHEIVRLADENGAEAVARAMISAEVLQGVRERDDTTIEEFIRDGERSIVRLTERVRSENADQA